MNNIFGQQILPEIFAQKLHQQFSTFDFGIRRFYLLS